MLARVRRVVVCRRGGRGVSARGGRKCGRGSRRVWSMRLCA